MRVRMSRGTLQTLYTAVLALWPPKASPQAQQRWGPLLHWPWRGAEVGFGVGIGPASVIACEAAMVDEAVDEAVFEVEAGLEDEAVSELGSAAELEFDAEAVRQPAFWAFELLEEAALRVLEGLGVVQSPLV